jgi:hypothetical protein
MPAGGTASGYATRRAALDLLPMAEVPVDKKRERDALHARLRQTYAELEPLKSGMSKEDLDRFEEIGEIIELLEKSEGSGRRQKRS